MCVGVRAKELEYLVSQIVWIGRLGLRIVSGWGMLGLHPGVCRLFGEGSRLVCRLFDSLLQILQQ